MKLTGNVYSVQKLNPDELAITAWVGFSEIVGRTPVTFRVPNNSRTRAAYRVGRDIAMNVTPKGAR